MFVLQQRDVNIQRSLSRVSAAAMQCFIQCSCVVGVCEDDDKNIYQIRMEQKDKNCLSSPCLGPLSIRKM